MYKPAESHLETWHDAREHYHELLRTLSDDPFSPPQHVGVTWSGACTSA